MKLFECGPEIEQYSLLRDFIKAKCINDEDLIVTNRFIVDAEQVDTKGAQILYQEEFGQGEPSDHMLIAMRDAIRRPYHRVIGIGGGTVLDLCKILSLNLDQVNDETRFYELLMNQHPIHKAAELILVPTTCGTGSEVTNVAVFLISGLNIKLGLANKALYADHAVLIPELIKSLPYNPMILSAIDALIHACESHLSPKANLITQSLSEKAIRLILKAFQRMAYEGKTSEESLSDLLLASNIAGLAFGNAGCGMVHAMSYPIGGAYHMPHGESNYEVFLPVLRFYEAKRDGRALRALKEILSESLCSNQPLDALEQLLEKLCHRRSLAEIGADPTVLEQFAASVMEKQQRLLSNAIQPIAIQDILSVYLSA